MTRLGRRLRSHAADLGPRHRARVACRGRGRSGTAARRRAARADPRGRRAGEPAHEPRPRSRPGPAHARLRVASRRAAQLDLGARGGHRLRGRRARPRADLRLARRAAALDPARRAALRRGQLRDRDLRPGRRARRRAARTHRTGASRGSSRTAAGRGSSGIPGSTRRAATSCFARFARSSSRTSPRPQSARPTSRCRSARQIADQISAAVSNPRNDQSSIADRRIAPHSGSLAAVGLTAGAALLVSGSRPDLEPWAVRESLVSGASLSTGVPALSVAGAMAATGRLENGACRALLRREPSREASPWPSIRIKTNADRPLPGAPPASPEPEDTKRGR